ncbi:esterase [Pluralibacter gergoviae]
MIELEFRSLNGNEVLTAYPQGAAGKALPCIIFYHGYTSSKRVYSYFAVALAEAGFRVIIPEAEDHGSRFSGDEARRLQRFWPILVNNFHEFPALYHAIEQEGWLLEGRLGVGGASMGGMTALGLVANYPQIQGAASLMGSGYLLPLSKTLYPSPEVPEDLTRWDVEDKLEALANRPLLLWHGEDDDVVPAADSHRLQQALAQQGGDSLLTCAWQSDVKHRITPEALDATVSFFRKHL